MFMTTLSKAILLLAFIWTSKRYLTLINHQILLHKLTNYGQCRINHGAGGAHAPGPLSSGASKFFKVIIFIHMKYTKNQK